MSRNIIYGTTDDFFGGSWQRAEAELDGDAAAGVERDGPLRGFAEVADLGRGHTGGEGDFLDVVGLPD